MAAERDFLGKLLHSDTLEKQEASTSRGLPQTHNFLQPLERGRTVGAVASEDEGYRGEAETERTRTLSGHYAAMSGMPTFDGGRAEHRVYLLRGDPGQGGGSRNAEFSTRHHVGRRGEFAADERVEYDLCGGSVRTELGMRVDLAGSRMSGVSARGSGSLGEVNAGVEGFERVDVESGHIGIGRNELGHFLDAPVPRLDLRHGVAGRMAERGLQVRDNTMGMDVAALRPGYFDVVPRMGGGSEQVFRGPVGTEIGEGFRLTTEEERIQASEILAKESMAYWSSLRMRFPPPDSGPGFRAAMEDVKPPTSLFLPEKTPPPAAQRQAVLPAHTAKLMAATMTPVLSTTTGDQSSEFEDGRETTTGAERAHGSARDPLLGWQEQLTYDTRQAAWVVSNIPRQSRAQMAHAGSEQRRRQKMNERFAALKELVPHSDQKKDKASFLGEVVDYIRLLHNKLRVYEGGPPAPQVVRKENEEKDSEFEREQNDVEDAEKGGESQTEEEAENEEERHRLERATEKSARARLKHDMGPEGLGLGMLATTSAGSDATAEDVRRDELQLPSTGLHHFATSAAGGLLSRMPPTVPFEKPHELGLSAATATLSTERADLNPANSNVSALSDDSKLVPSVKQARFLMQQAQLNASLAMAMRPSVLNTAARSSSHGNYYLSGSGADVGGDAAEVVQSGIAPSDHWPLLRATTGGALQPFFISQEASPSPSSLSAKPHTLPQCDASLKSIHQQLLQPPPSPWQLFYSSGALPPSRSLGSLTFPFEPISKPMGNFPPPLRSPSSALQLPLSPALKGATMAQKADVMPPMQGSTRKMGGSAQAPLQWFSTREDASRNFTKATSSASADGSAAADAAAERRVLIPGSSGGGEGPCPPESPPPLSLGDAQVEGGVINVSTVYNKGLLETLTRALQSSGVDLSQANISVQIDLGKTASNRSTALPARGQSAAAGISSEAGTYSLGAPPVMLPGAPATHRGRSLPCSTWSSLEATGSGAADVLVSAAEATLGDVSQLDTPPDTVPSVGAASSSMAIGTLDVLSPAAAPLDLEVKRCEEGAEVQACSDVTGVPRRSGAAGDADRERDPPGLAPHGGSSGGAQVLPHSVAGSGNQLLVTSFATTLPEKRKREGDESVPAAGPAADSGQVVAQVALWEEAKNSKRLRRHEE